MPRFSACWVSAPRPPGRCARCSPPARFASCASSPARRPRARRSPRQWPMSSVPACGCGPARVRRRRGEARGGDVTCAPPTPAEPVFDAAWIAPGAHVSGIGAYRLDMRELPAALFSRASLVAVDSREAALEEAGDLVAALEAGLLAPDGYVEIGTLPADWAQRRDPDAITVFKSVGLAIQDVAAAEVATRRLLAG